MSTTITASGTATIPRTTPSSAGGSAIHGSATAPITVTTGTAAGQTGDFDYVNSLQRDANYFQELQGLIGFMCQSGAAGLGMTPRAAIYRLHTMLSAMLQQGGPG